MSCKVIVDQQLRMKLYKELLSIASCEEEKKALHKAYEISRLIHIKHEDVIERSSWLLEKEKIEETKQMLESYYKVIEDQQVRMKLYKQLIDIASCDEEKKALYNSYEISRLIYIKHEDVVERSSWLLEKEKIEETKQMLESYYNDTSDTTTFDEIKDEMVEIVVHQLPLPHPEAYKFVCGWFDNRR